MCHVWKSVSCFSVSSGVSYGSSCSNHFIPTSIREYEIQLCIKILKGFLFFIYYLFLFFRYVLMILSYFSVECLRMAELYY